MGQFHSRVTGEVHDPLTVTALAIETENGKEQTILVSCDRVGIPEDVIDMCRQRVDKRAAGVDVRKVILFATHTHNAPVMMEGVYPPDGPEVMTPTEYAEFFAERVADCAVEAWEKRGPSGFSWAYGYAVVGRNRRLVYADGSSRMYGKSTEDSFLAVEGYEDHGVDMLFTWDSNRELTGMVINLACPSQVDESEFFVSADFWHETRLEIRKRYGENVHVLAQCSAAGDQSPHVLVNKRADRRMLELKDPSERQDIANRIAAAVDDVLPASRSTIETEFPFAHVVKTIQLTRRLVSDQEAEQAREALCKLESESPSADRARSRNFVLRRRNRTVLERHEEQKTAPAVPMELHVIRLGDIVMATNPFELFLDFGLRMKCRSDALQTFVVQLAGNGGYLPTRKAVGGRGYGAEIASNLVGPEGGQELVERTLEEIHDLWG